MEEKYLAFDKGKLAYYIAGLALCFILGIGYCWSVIQTPFVQAVGGDSYTSAVALVYTITVLCSTMSPTILGGITRHLKTNQLLLIGAVMFGVGWILSGYVVNVAMLIIVYGLLTGVGTGLMYPTLMGYAASAFPERTGIASGLFAGVYGGSAMIWSPILASYINSAGLKIALTVIGIICLVVCVIGGFIIRPVPEGYIDWKKAQVGAGTAGDASKSAAPVQTVPDKNRGQMVKTAIFYVAAIAFAFGLTSGMLVISQSTQIMIGQFGESNGITATNVAIYASLLSLMSMAGRIVWGTVTDHADKYVTLCIICAIPIVTMGILAFSHNMVLTVVCMSLTALCYGGFGGTITPITADLFGSKYITENYGVMYLMFGIAGLIGPQVAVNLRTQTSTGYSYSTAFIVGCVLAVISLIAAIVVRNKVKANAKKAAAEAAN